MSCYKSFLGKLSQRESSGSANAINSAGYIGLYQMGEAALIDAGYIERNGSIYDNNYQDYQWTGVDGIESYSYFLKR